MPDRALRRVEVLLGFVLGACNGSVEDEGRAPAATAGARDDAGAPAPIGADPDACPDALGDFETNLWNPLLSVKCLGCHNLAGPAGNTRMVLRGEGGEEALRENYRAAAAVASIDVAGRALLLAMPSNTNPEREHPGGEIVPEESTEYGVLEAFVTRVRSASCDAPTSAVSCTDVVPGPRALRRLTPVEYDNTIADVFGDVSAAGAKFPADPVVGNFRNQSDALTVTPLLADVLQVSGEGIAEAAELSRFAPCVATALDEGCATTFVASVGRKLFRRPLTADETGRYVALFAGAGADEAALRLVVGAMLQSPHFLYRSELGTLGDDGLYRLDDHEIASELSYLFWQTLPDDPLMAEADAGRLRTPAQIEAQASRLLASPRARPVLGRFVLEWLRLDAIESVPKDAASFPELDAAVRAAMAREAERLIDEVVFERAGTLAELLTTPTAFVDATLAPYYGLPDPASGDALVAVDASAVSRSGILTSGGLMLVHARSNDASPIHRGRLVRERLLCQVPPPPPPGINAEPPALDPSLTARERYAAHSAMEPCHSCHRLLDPIGFAFEHFDGAGRYRETDNGHAIDASGEIVSSPTSDATFEGTAELAALLAASTDVRDCFSTQAFRYGLGLSESQDTQCMLESLQDEFRAGDGSITELWLALVRSPHFTTRVRGPVGDAVPTSGDATGAGDPAPSDSDPPAGDTPIADDAPSPLPEGLTLEQIQDDDWGAGYCHGYRIENVGTTTVTWSIELPVTGTIDNNWECTVTLANGIGTFAGLSHNRDVPPGGSAQFGFCATR